MENFYSKDIKRVSLWGRMLGSLLIVYGGILLFQGLFSYIIGALPGVIAMIMGKQIHDSGKEAQEVLRSNGRNVGAVDYMLRYISLFLLLLGILMIMVIVLYALFFIIGMYYY